MSDFIEEEGDINAVEHVCDAILAAAGGELKFFAQRKNCPTIIGAGFLMALRDLGEQIDPLIPYVVRMLLVQEFTNLLADPGVEETEAKH